jgi:hypothetical protein
MVFEFGGDVEGCREKHVVPAGVGNDRSGGAEQL